MFTLASSEPVPAVSIGQMREVDRSMAGYFGVDLTRMMENPSTRGCRAVISAILAASSGAGVPVKFTGPK
jgi:hypothetical protein